jgi:hypothetical protein
MTMGSGNLGRRAIVRFSVVKPRSEMLKIGQMQRKFDMSPGNVDDINAPKSMKNIVLEVMDYINAHHPPEDLSPGEWPPTDFDTYDQALHVVWPELYKTDPKAALLVSVSIYIDIAERWFFEATPSEIKELRL